MSEKTAVKTREKWVDDVKVIACILVVLGHFFQSMTKANILPENDLYEWFNTTIYYFHVPLFFICSGYLYQKYSKVNSVGSWRRNVAKKVLALGVPYMTFTTATWVLKKLFSGSINGRVGGFIDTLIFEPAAPYWYLYALFFIFLVTPTFNSVKAAAVGLVVALAGVRYSITNPDAYVESNLVGFFNILEACRHCESLEHLVYASSSSVYGSNKKVPYSTDDKVDNPVSLYAATKKSNELMAHAYSKLYNIPSTGLRFFTVYGPAGRPDMAYFGFTNKLVKGDTIKIFNYGNCKRDFTYVDDIVEGVV